MDKSRRVTFFGHEFVPTRQQKPVVVSLALSKDCNLACKHCYSDSTKIVRGLDLSTPNWVRVIDQLAGLGCEILSFTGGEPLLVWKHVLNLGAYARSHGMGVGMVTNGVLVTREIARDIAKIGLTVTVSIDGMSRFHDWLRGRHTFELATQGIRTLVDTDVPTFVLMTVMKGNLDEIDNVTSLCEDLGVQQLMLTVLKARGRAVQLYDTQAPSQTDLFHLYEKLITRLVAFVDGRETMPLWFLCQPLFHTYLVKEKPEISRLLEVLPSVQCRAGRSRLMISSDGSVYVCPFIPAVVGNVKKMSLKEIWNESNSLVRLRDREFIGRCLQCEYKIPCGGCRARAYMTTGDLLESDPTCPW